MHMTVKQRILTIRLMEKLEDHPAYAEALGIEAAGGAREQNMESDPRGLTEA